MELKGFQRSYLTKMAHTLRPSVQLGVKGLTDALIKQTDEMLEHHELIKVKFVDFKSSKDVLSEQLCKATDAELIRIIGNVAILFRQAREPEHRAIKIPAKKI